MPSQPPRLNARVRLLALAVFVTALTPVAGVAGARAEPSGGGPADVVDATGTNGRIVVRWEPQASPTARSAAREGAETDPVRTLGRTDFQLLDLEPGQTLRGALSELRADPRVAAADPDRYLSTLAMPDDPDLPKQWALQADGPTPSAGSPSASSGAVNAPPAWNRTVGTPDTVVAVIDGGYDFDVPDLGAVAWTNPDEVPGNGIDDDENGFVDDVRGWDFVGANAANPAPDNDPTDDDPVSGGHGAHVAGILGAQGNDGQGITGVAQDVRLMPLRVCSRASVQGANRCLLSAVVQAVNYAGRNGARVANLSLGGGGYDQVFADALAANPRTLYVAAAGNDGRDTGKHPVYPCSYDPVADSKVAGRVDNVVCVAALDQKGKPASFTNWGARDVDLAAPGVDIWSVYRDYRREVVWSEDFEGDDFAERWISTGPGPGAPGDGPLVSTGLTDSPGAAPSAGEHQVRSQPFAVPAGAEYCEIRGERFARLAQTEDFSYSLWVEGAEGPSTLSLAVTWPKTELKKFSTDVVDASEMAGKQVSLHVDYTAPGGLDETYGFWLDNLSVACGAVVSPAPYRFLSGTSMASPMVAGAAALLFSLKPSATAVQVRKALVGSAHRLTSWKKKTVSGGRLDVAAAMGRLVPPGTRLTAQPAVAGRNVALAVAQDGDLEAITFQCRLDDGRFRTCNPRGVFRGVAPGKHLLTARAVDPYGNVDPTPVTARFTVQGCLVPRVLGMTPARARTLLLEQGCTIGKVTRQKGVPFKQLRVRAVGPKPGVYSARTGLPVRVYLGR